MKITKCRGVLATLAGLALCSAMAVAQTMGSSSQNNMTKVSPADKMFVDKAAQGGQAEVELGQLAEQNGSSQEVKDFGKRMVDDHSKANDQLKQLASQEGITLPNGLDAKDKATKEKLEKLHGAAFDKAYMKDMVMDHRKDVAEFKKESTTASNSSIKDWAGKTLPTLQSHLEMAEQIAPKVGDKGVAEKGMNNNQSTMAH